MPEAGFDITFPDDWFAILPAAEALEFITAAAARDPMLASLMPAETGDA